MIWIPNLYIFNIVTSSFENDCLPVTVFVSVCMSVDLQGSEFSCADCVTMETRDSEAC